MQWSREVGGGQVTREGEETGRREPVGSWGRLGTSGRGWRTRVVEQGGRRVSGDPCRGGLAGCMRAMGRPGGGQRTWAEEDPLGCGGKPEEMVAYSGRPDQGDAKP